MFFPTSNHNMHIAHLSRMLRLSLPCTLIQIKKSRKSIPLVNYAFDLQLLTLASLLRSTATRRQTLSVHLVNHAWNMNNECPNFWEFISNFTAILSLFSPHCVLIFFFRFRLNSLCVPIPATEFVRVQIKWQQKWIMHFHRLQNQNKKKRKNKNPTKIEHLSTMVWILNSFERFSVFSSELKKSSNGETVYARPTEPAASRKRIA